jgi:hypothetical protein
MAAERAPAGLGPGGNKLWRDITAEHTLDAAQKVLLLEACRMKDRLDQMNQEITGRGDFLRVQQNEDGDYVLRVDRVVGAASRDANVLKQLITALRLPETDTGKRPQQRGARGAYAKAMPKGVSSLERARAAKTS